MPTSRVLGLAFAVAVALAAVLYVSMADGLGPPIAHSDEASAAKERTPRASAGAPPLRTGEDDEARQEVSEAFAEAPLKPKSGDSSVRLKVGSTTGLPVERPAGILVTNGEPRTLALSEAAPSVLLLSEDSASGDGEVVISAPGHLPWRAMSIDLRATDNQVIEVSLVPDLQVVVRAGKLAADVSRVAFDQRIGGPDRRRTEAALTAGWVESDYVLAMDSAVLKRIGLEQLGVDVEFKGLGVSTFEVPVDSGARHVIDLAGLSDLVGWDRGKLQVQISKEVPWPDLESPWSGGSDSAEAWLTDGAILGDPRIGVMGGLVVAVKQTGAVDGSEATFEGLLADHTYLVIVRDSLSGRSGYKYVRIDPAGTRVTISADVGVLVRASGEGDQGFPDITWEAFSTTGGARLTGGKLHLRENSSSWVGLISPELSPLTARRIELGGSVVDLKFTPDSYAAKASPIRPLVDLRGSEEVELSLLSEVKNTLPLLGVLDYFGSIKVGETLDLCLPGADTGGLLRSQCLAASRPGEGELFVAPQELVETEEGPGLRFGGGNGIVLSLEEAVGRTALLVSPDGIRTTNALVGLTPVDDKGLVWGMVAAQRSEISFPLRAADGGPLRLSVEWGEMSVVVNQPELSADRALVQIDVPMGSVAILERRSADGDWIELGRQQTAASAKVVFSQSGSSEILR